MPDATAPAGFPIRGFHLDLRVQVMTPAALHALANELAAAGLNTLIVEWEASFPYARQATISHARAYQPDEVRAFLAHCDGLGLEVIPLQQTLGHLEHLLRHARYASLREDEKDFCQICPRKIATARLLVRELIADLQVHHRSRWIHLGGDEAYLLGHCPVCRAHVKSHGLAHLYSEYMAMVLEEARAAGLRPILWADMLLKHPECLHLLPRDTVLVDWNYGWALDRFGSPATLVQAGFEVWGAAALRSAPDNHSLTFWRRHLDNFTNFIPQARRHGYRAMILTSWSTSGVFGYWWDDNAEVLDLLPIRRVYPLNGHRLLLWAFVQALEESGIFCPEDFLNNYGQERFGLEPDSAHRFARALLAQAPQGVLPPVGERLADLAPVRNHDEFAHLRLIEALHGLQAEFRAIEDRFQAPDYTRAQAPLLRNRLDALTARSRSCSAEYRRLQRDYLHSDEIEMDIAYREKAQHTLCRVLQNQSGAGGPILPAE